MNLLPTRHLSGADEAPARRRRGDIDGLRAIAVLGVIAFHLGVPGLPGGFAGVDVFFVISGYLIAGILVAELEAGRFSLLSFYDRRIRRILPAITVASLVTALIGYFVLLPADYENFAYSLLSVATFSSNFYFMSKTGYFGGHADEFPLLHTWSLAIEEQFYLIFPLALMLIWYVAPRLNRPVLHIARWTIGTAILVSFLFSLYLVDARPERAFFSTPARIWELLAGALLAVGIAPAIASARTREVTAAAGFVLILASFLALDSTTPFPGLAAGLPVLGTLLFLHAGTNGSTWTGKLVSLPPLIVIGLASYSIYLWHWPLIALARYRWPMEVTEGSGLAPGPVIAVGLLSLGLGLLSRRYVELPFLQMALPRDPRRTIEWALVPTLASSALAVAIIAGDGWWHRWPAAIRERQAWTAQESGWFRGACKPFEAASAWPKHACRAGAEGPQPQTLLWGDSHARRLLRGLETGLNARNHAVAAAITPGCPPLIGIRVEGRSRTKSRCNNRNSAVYEALRQKSIRTVILVARWGLYAEGSRYGLEGGEFLPMRARGATGNKEAVTQTFERTVSTLLDLGLRVIIVGPVPEQKVPVTSFMLRRQAWGTPNIADLPVAEFEKRQQHILPLLQTFAQRPGVDVLLPHLTLCADGFCRYAENGNPLYIDHDHLNDQGLAAIDSVTKRLLNVIDGAPQSDVPSSPMGSAGD